MAGSSLRPLTLGLAQEDVNARTGLCRGVELLLKLGRFAPSPTLEAYKHVDFEKRLVRCNSCPRPFPLSPTLGPYKQLAQLVEHQFSELKDGSSILPLFTIVTVLGLGQRNFLPTG